jgi:hypothetical protein
MLYNLSDENRKIVDMALTVLAREYDQHGFRSPDEILRIRGKFKKCTTVQLITDTSKRTFADEA